VRGIAGQDALDPRATLMQVARAPEAPQRPDQTKARRGVATLQCPPQSRPQVGVLTLQVRVPRSPLRPPQWLHNGGYLRPIAAVRPEVERLCDEITAYLRTPVPPRTPPPRLRHAPAEGVPPLWRAWVAAHQHPTPPARSA
jgi:hypothetical protein